MKSIIITFIFITSIFANENLEKVSLQLKWKYQFQFAGFIAAKEKGFYKDAGLDVTLKEYDTHIDIINDVRDAKSDFGISDSSLIYEALQNKSFAALMAIYQRSPFILMGLKSSGIQTLKDTKGKQLALYEGLNGIAVKAMLKINNIDYHVQPPIFTMDKLLSGEIDMMTAYISNEPFVAQQKNLEIVSFSPRDYGFDGYGDILFTSQEMIKNRPEIVEKMYDASYKGWEYAFNHIDEMIDLIYENYNTLHKTKEALRYEAETLKLLSGYGKNFGELDLQKIQNIAHIYGFIDSKHYDMGYLDDFIYPLNTNNTIALTQEEKNYLADNTFRYAGDPNCLPFEAFDKQGNHVGIIADHMKIMEQKFHIKLNKIIRKDCLMTSEHSKISNTDIISGNVSDLTLSKNYTPIDSYIENPIVIVTRDNHPYVADIKQLKDKKIAISNEAGHKEDIIKKYPDIHFIETKNIQSGLIGVKSGKYDALIDSLAMSDYHIVKMGIENLKISGDTGMKMRLTFFVNKEKMLLHSILNKMMKSLDEIEKQKIISKWRHSSINEVIIDTTMVRNLSIVFFIILAFVLLFLYQVKKSNQRLKLLLNSTIEAVAIFKHGKLVDANNIVLKLYGYDSVNEIKGKPASEFVPKEQHAFLKEQLMNSSEPYELDMIRKDGSSFPALVRGTNIDSNTRISSVLDLSELKNAQKELIELNTSLEQKVVHEVEKNKDHQLIMFQQSRHAQMGEMISMIAHQWRQPLNNLSLMIQGVLLKYKLNELNDDTISTIHIDIKAQIQQMSQTIDDFRDFFKPNKEKKDFNINKTILHVTNLLNPVFKKENIHVRLDAHEDIYVKGYPNELGQAIINILNNAKDVLIEKNKEKEKRINIALKQEETTIVITIEDNGGGITSDNIDTIFTPYFSTKQDKNGTGLGLYMCKTIIEEHCNGKLSVKNGSEGAIFTIELRR